MGPDNRYRLIRRLGGGGMGTVHEAYDEKLAKKVAVKILNVQHGDVKQIQRLRVEAKALGAVSHPNIVTILTCHTNEEDVPFLVIDYIDGVTLDKCSPLSDASFRKLFSQIADALAHAHEHGIVHRDLKPSNIMVTADGDARILDFGVSKLLGLEDQRLTRTGEVIGTPHYISPEQCTQQSVDKRADIYMLGLCMYFALTGCNPYDAENVMELVMKQASEPLDCSALPAEYRGLISRCVAKKPDDRFQDVAQIRDILTGKSSAPQPAHRVRPAHLLSPRVQIIAAATLVGICVSCFVVSKFASTTKETRPDAEALYREVERATAATHGEKEEDLYRHGKYVVSVADKNIPLIDGQTDPVELGAVLNLRARYLQGPIRWRATDDQQVALAAQARADLWRACSLTEAALADKNTPMSQRALAALVRADSEIRRLAETDAHDVPIAQARLDRILKHCEESVSLGMRQDYKDYWLYQCNSLIKYYTVNNPSPVTVQRLEDFKVRLAKVVGRDEILNTGYFKHTDFMHLGPNIHKPLMLQPPNVEPSKDPSL